MLSRNYKFYLVITNYWPYRLMYDRSMSTKVSNFNKKYFKMYMNINYDVELTPLSRLYKNLKSYVCSVYFLKHMKINLL